jgi:hypothetical protein
MQEKASEVRRKSCTNIVLSPYRLKLLMRARQGRCTGWPG